MRLLQKVYSFTYLTIFGVKNQTPGVNPIKLKSYKISKNYKKWLLCNKRDHLLIRKTLKFYRIGFRLNLREKGEAKIFILLDVFLLLLFLYY